MGKKKKSIEQPSISQRLRSFLAEKNPILLFLLAFSGLMIVFYAFWLTDFFKENVFHPVLNINADIASFLLNIFGYGTLVSGKNISNNFFSISVEQGCDAIEPVALFISAILAFPASVKKKVRGILVGVIFLLSVNLLRIISLFLTGIYAPSVFDLMHLEVWQVVFILLAVACWLVWINWSMKPAVNKVVI